MKLRQPAVCFGFLFLPCSSSRSFSPSIRQCSPIDWKKVVVLLNVVEVAELVHDGVGHLHVVLLEPFGEDGLTLLLNFS